MTTENSYRTVTSLANADVDRWAVTVVVTEGQYMNLSLPERILATHMMRARGHTIGEMAERLRTTNRAINRYLSRQVPMLDWMQECP